MNELAVGTKDVAEHPGNYSVESKMKGIGVAEGTDYKGAPGNCLG